jgi:hypothetical protein
VISKQTLKQLEDPLIIAEIKRLWLENAEKLNVKADAKAAKAMDEGDVEVALQHWIASVHTKAVMSVSPQYSPLKANILRWKPKADGGVYPGKLVILVKGSEGISFKVNGERKNFKAKGPNNGYQSCDMTPLDCSKLPKPSVLTLWDKDGKQVKTAKGQTDIIIKDPTQNLTVAI